MRTHGGGEEGLNQGETPGVVASEQEDGRSGPVMCGQQMGQVVVDALGVLDDLGTPDQAEKEAVMESVLLQRAPVRVQGNWHRAERAYRGIRGGDEHG